MHVQVYYPAWLFGEWQLTATFQGRLDKGSMPPVFAVQSMQVRAV